MIMNIRKMVTVMGPITVMEVVMVMVAMVTLLGVTVMAATVVEMVAEENNES